ncbi:hypothetical protein D6D13_00223 [Aureobasidium pullulans]|uniref:Uncharacterized protein n=1 Tax=Aureobasidium pullulans TaxID=5580 RepID=A0A4S9DFG8_AURPU|nr:hypothetical protein D6D13_00223 [Aureobasidium pullulans]
MPSLKQLTCSIELGSTHTKITEYGNDYGDGHVTSYVAVPAEEVNFSIHLTSSGYIAPGLAMFVYMDGHYQCNRNRRGLVVPGEKVKPEHFEVDLRVRQKESKQPDGSFLGRDWSFHGLNLVSADTVEETSDAFLENLGTIEVIVLRCKDAPQPPVNVPTPRASTVEDSIRSSRENTSKPTSRPASKQSSKQCSRHEQKEPSVKAKAPSKEPSAKEKIPSKVPSKVESKAAPKPPTAKTESEIGGFFGLFDGASDDPSIQPKPYWSDWNKRPVNNGPHPSRRDLMYIAPEDPLPSVPKAVARSKHVEHQVKTGKGAQYLHLCARPEYLDSMQKPYAVFTFKYRSKRVIEKKFKITIKEEGEHLKAKLADMSKDELAEELYRLRMAGKESSSSKKISTPDKVSTTAKPTSHKAASAQPEATSKDLPPPQGNTWEMSADKTPAKAPSKVASKAPTAPAMSWDATPQADWGTAPAPQQSWDTTTPQADWGSAPTPQQSWDATTPAPAKSASKHPSKTPSRTPSKTPSQKTKEAPGSFPASSHSQSQAAAGASSHHASHKSKPATKAPTIKSNKEASAAAGNDWDQAPAAAAGNWGQTNADPSAWDTAPAGKGGDAAWGGTPADAKADKGASFTWENARIVITIIGVIAAVAFAVIAYYWIKSYVFKAIGLYFLLRAWIVAPFAWSYSAMLKIANLNWLFAPLAWIKEMLLKLVEKIAGVQMSKPRFLEGEFWKMEVQRPDWMAWPEWPDWFKWLKWPQWSGWEFRVPEIPEIVKDGFSVLIGWLQFMWSLMRPDGVQTVEDVVEDI